MIVNAFSFLPAASKKNWQKMLPFFGSSVVILAAMVIGKLASFLWRLVFVRNDIVLLGEIEVFTTTLGLATTFSMLAFPAALTRFSLRNRRKAAAYFVYAFLRTAKMFVVVSVFLWIFSRFAPLFTSHTQLALPVFLGLILVVAGQKLALAYLNSLKKFTLYGLGEYVFIPVLKIVFLIAIFGGLLSKTLLFPHVVISTAVGAVLVIGLALRNMAAESIFSLSEAEKKRFFSYSLLLSGSLIAFIVYGSLDVYLLQYFFGSATVGAYAGLLTLINLMDLIFLPFLHTFQAHLADRKSNAAKIRFTVKTTLFLFRIGLALGIILALAGTFVLPVISNNALQVSLPVMMAFVVYKTLHFGLVHVYRHYFDFQGKQSFTAKSMVASLGLKVILGLALVRAWGIPGLALTNILADLFHIWWLRRAMRAAAA